MKSFQIIAKPAGAVCNLNCRYCFYLEKENLYPRSSFRMNGPVLDNFIRQHIEQQDSDTINFVWQGGEPTLIGIEYYENIVKLQNKYSSGKRIENALQTNGVLINDEWCWFFLEHKFLIGISIDGPEELHDAYRTDKAERPTFKKVMSGMECLKKHNVDFNTITVVHKQNSLFPKEVYHFIKECGSGYMQFIPVVERTDVLNRLASPDNRNEDKVTEWSVEPTAYGNFLCSIFDEWVKKDVGKYFVQIFDVALESWLGLKQSLCIFNKSCGTALALEHNGDLYPCDHYVFPENRLGNIMETS